MALLKLRFVAPVAWYLAPVVSPIPRILRLGMGVAHDVVVIDCERDYRVKVAQIYDLSRSSRSARNKTLEEIWVMSSVGLCLLHRSRRCRPPNGPGSLVRNPLHHSSYRLGILPAALVLYHRPYDRAGFRSFESLFSLSSNHLRQKPHVESTLRSEAGQAKSNRKILFAGTQK